MPYRPKRICSAPGCSELVQGRTRCDKHSQQHNKDKKNKNHWNDWYSKPRWRRLRHRFLCEHPFCTHCLKNKKIIIATVVDHIIPHKGNTELFWDTDNMQSLCKKCHDKKTATENGTFGN